MSSAKFKILYVSGTACIGGGEVSLISLLKGLNKRLFHPIVILPSAGPLESELKKLGIETRYCPVIEFSKRRIVFFVIDLLKLAALIDRESIDLVHANSIYTSELSWFAASSRGVPCICHVRDLAPVLGAGKIRSFTFRKMSRVIAISEAVKSDLIQKLKIPEKKIIRIYNGVDTEEFNPGISGEDFRREFNLNFSKLVGMAGRFSPEKGQEFFLRTAAEIIKEYKDVHFIVIGGADLGSRTFKQAMMRLSDDLGLQNRIIFTGFRDDFPRVMAALDIAVVPSAAEPFGRVIIEAMAAGVPVVATNSGAAPEIISKEAGMLVEPNNVEELKKAIIKLLSDVRQSKHMGEEGRKLILEKFDVRRHVSAMEELYHEILSRRHDDG